METVLVCADGEYCSLAIGVEESKGAQDRGDLSLNDDRVEGSGHGELLAAQIVRSVCPVADGAVIAAVAALPTDRCVWLSADHDDAARAGAVGGSASARQGAFPGGAGISGGACCDDAG